MTVDFMSEKCKFMNPNPKPIAVMSENQNKITKFWHELKRRKVFGVVTTYAATAYIIIEVTNNLVDSLHLPDWIGPVVVLLLVIGLPFAVILSWIFDFTPQGITKTESIEESSGKEIIAKPSKRKLRPSYILNAVLIIAVIILAFPKIFRQDALKRLTSSGEKISIAVIPFQNLTNDTTWNILKDAIQMNLISALSNTGELKVRQKETINTLLKAQNISAETSVSPSVANTISKKLDADIFVCGNIQKAGSILRLNAQLIDTKTNDVLKSIEIDGPYREENLLGITDSLRKKVTDFLLISKLIKENPWYGQFSQATGSPEAFKYLIYGDRLKNTAVNREGLTTAVDWFLKALAVDSNYFLPMNGLVDVYQFMGEYEESLNWLNKIYQRKDQWSMMVQVGINWMYAINYEPPEEGIRYLKQLLQNDDQNPTLHWLLGNAYSGINQYDNAIPELKKAIELLHEWGIDDSYYYRDLGWAYHKTGQYEKERKLYRRAEKYVMDDQTIISCRAVLSLTVKDTVKAKRNIEKYTSFCRDNSISESEIAEGIGYIYWKADIADKAEKYFRKALLLDPDNANSMNVLANRLIEMNKNFDEVSELIEKALKLARNKWDYYFYLDTKGWGLYKSGKYQEALDLFQNLWDSAPYKMYFMKSHLDEVRKAVKPSLLN